MSPSQRGLRIAAYSNFAIALLHVGFAFAPAGVSAYFGAPRWFLQMLDAARPHAVVLMAAVAAAFILFALYALSGAGAMRHLPLLRTILVVIGIVYTLRGLLFPLDVIVVIRHSGAYSQFLVFSLISLCIGILYLVGVGRNWEGLKPTHSSMI